jgi:septum formation protein
MRLILASASPRRAELLRAAGFDFQVLAPDIDESVLAGESPERYARRLAEAKARAVLARSTHEPVLAADTVVVADGVPLGKPADQADAARILRRLSGREHIVMTAVCLMTSPGPAEAGQYDNRQGRARGERVQTAVAQTSVEFAVLSDTDIAWYVGTGEPRDKAGAYAVQGLASRFVTRIDGSYSNVVGLPIAVVYDLCKRAGLLIC